MWLGVLCLISGMVVLTILQYSPVMVLEQTSAAALHTRPLPRIDPVSREHSHMALDILTKEAREKEMRNFVRAKWKELCIYWRFIFTCLNSCAYQLETNTQSFISFNNANTEDQVVINRGIKIAIKTLTNSQTNFKLQTIRNHLI